MFSKKTDKTLLFIFGKESRVSLHMVFVFYPIDIMFLDEKKKVVELKQGLRPFGFYIPKNKARYIIESPYGTIKKSKTRIGDKISF
jgi:uncharacterized membrane protein (UPF0127 family)